MPNIAAQLNWTKVLNTESTNTKTIKVTTNKKSCSVALPTATVQIDSMFGYCSQHTVGVVFDTAAQQSLISRDIIED